MSFKWKTGLAGKGFAFLVMSLLVIAGCAEKKGRVKDVAATIDGQNILLSDIDPLIQSELYESIFNTYYARKLAIDKIVSDRLLSRQANDAGIGVDSLIRRIKVTHDNKENVDKYIAANNLRGGIPDPQLVGRVLPLDSKEGSAVLRKFFLEYVVDEYVDSLKKLNKVEVFIEPPLPPVINLEGVSFHKISKATTKKTVWIFSDFGCGHCQQFYPTLKALLEKHGSNVEFRYTTLTSEVTDNVLAAEYAANHNKFWDAAQLIFTSNLNSGEVLNKIGIKKEGYTADKELFAKIKANNDKIGNLKLFTATPTIVVNGRIYYGNVSFSELDKYIANYCY